MYKRGKGENWYERFVFPDGTDKRICLGTSDPKLAEKIKAKISTDILMDKHFKMKLTRKKSTVREMLAVSLDLKEDEVKDDSWTAEKYWVRAINRDFGDLLVDSVSGDMIEKYIKSQRKLGLKDGTIGDRLRSFKRAYEVGRRKHFTDNDPFADVKIPTNKGHRVRYLTDEERTTLLDALSQSKYLWLRDFVIVACDTGFRRRNMVEMTWKNVCFKSKTISFASDETKTKQPLMVPMSDAVYDILIRLHNRDKRGVVFKNQLGKPINRQSLTNQFTKLTRKFGIEDFHIHDMRHDFCSQLALGGAELYDIKELAGHTNIEQTMRYVHLMPKRKREAIEVMNKKRHEDMRIRVVK